MPHAMMMILSIGAQLVVAEPHLVELEPAVVVNRPSRVSAIACGCSAISLSMK